MSLITIVISLVVVGVALWLISLIPMDAMIKKILNITVIIVCVIWLLKVFGIWAYLSNVKI